MSYYTSVRMEKIKAFMSTLSKQKQIQWLPDHIGDKFIAQETVVGFAELKNIGKKEGVPISIFTLVNKVMTK